MVKAALLALALPALLAGCLAGAPPAGPTGQIDGAVVDHLLHPFANQTVHLSQLGWKDQTSPLGGFTFRNVPVGSYLLLAARDGTQGAAVAVDVEAGRVTKVILQLLPTPVRDPRIVLVPPHVGIEGTAAPHSSCDSCTWTVPLDAGERPTEIVIEGRWDADLLGHDGLSFQVTDDLGDRLLATTPQHPPFSGAILGADVPAEARELRVHVQYGDDFTPRANFRLQTFMTLYYGATKDQIFG